MSIRVHVNGQILAEKDARVSVFDRSFLYGDGVFETLRTVNGVLFSLTEHLERLERSAARIGIVCPPRAMIAEAVHATVVAANNLESRVRIIVSRGEGWGDLDPRSIVESRLVVMVAEQGGPTPEMYARGVSAMVVSVMHNHPEALDPTVKSGNYLNSIMAIGEARRAGAHEAILRAPNGCVAEGATSNLFAVIGGRVTTPALAVGILPGITRRFVLEICRQEGIDVDETISLSPEALRSASEVFLTSALRGVLPVSRLDGQDVGPGHPGPVTRGIMAAYAALASRKLAGSAS